jgi:hypothetical protein
MTFGQKLRLSEYFDPSFSTFYQKKILPGREGWEGWEGFFLLFG